MIHEHRCSGLGRELRRRRWRDGQHRVHNHRSPPSGALSHHQHHHHHRGVGKMLNTITITERCHHTTASRCATRRPQVSRSTSHKRERAQQQRYATSAMILLSPAHGPTRGTTYSSLLHWSKADPTRSSSRSAQRAWQQRRQGWRGEHGNERRHTRKSSRNTRERGRAQERAKERESRRRPREKEERQSNDTEQMHVRLLFALALL